MHDEAPCHAQGREKGAVLLSLESHLRTRHPLPVEGEVHLAILNVDGQANDITTLPRSRPGRLCGSVVPTFVPHPVSCPTMNIVSHTVAIGISLLIFRCQPPDLWMPLEKILVQRNLMVVPPTVSREVLGSSREPRADGWYMLRPQAPQFTCIAHAHVLHILFWSSTCQLLEDELWQLTWLHSIARIQPLEEKCTLHTRGQVAGTFSARRNAFQELLGAH
mmetsp:Transcript_110547/g.200886  ORF Transcript_110547/g.200886 Transcript_110547/m.200886 type:complete len:220 (+) Transcript_110547:785-1444(+)